MKNEGKYKPWISQIIHWTLGPSTLAHWNLLWASQNTGWIGVLLYHSLDKTLLNFLNTVKFSALLAVGYKGYVNVGLGSEESHHLPFCHPHALKPSNTLDEWVAVRICTPLSQNHVRSLILKCMVLKASITVWLDGVHDEHWEFALRQRMWEFLLCPVRMEPYVWPTLSIRN